MFHQKGRGMYPVARLRSLGPVPTWDHEAHHETHLGPPRVMSMAAASQALWKAPPARLDPYRLRPASIQVHS